jgi:hypothetical protein
MLLTSGVDTVARRELGLWYRKTRLKLGPGWAWVWCGTTGLDIVDRLGPRQCGQAGPETCKLVCGQTKSGTGIVKLDWTLWTGWAWDWYGKT